MIEDERPPEELSFEEAMESLELIVSSLESERLPLEDMVRSYERGAKLLGLCRSRIESARQRVEVITADMEGRGRVTLSDFATMEESSSSSPPPGNAPAEESTPKRTTRKKTNQDESEEGEIRLF